MERVGRYEILEELGHGAMGRVYRARDPKINRIVALKTISIVASTPAEEEEFRERFFREAQAAGALSHPGIVTIFDVGEDEASNTPYTVMEFIEGKTLAELAASPTEGGTSERLPLKTAVDLARQVAEALDYAHAHQIIHRDIKPANILVTADGRAKIADFGIAKLQTSQFTQPGQVLGTPAYMSPEQLTGEAIDGRSDLFSLGVVLYWLLTGDKPFAGDTTNTISFKVVYSDPIPPSKLMPSLSPHYDHVVRRALAKNPAQRYATGRALADDLEDLLADRPPRSLAGAAPAPEGEATIAAGAAPLAAAAPSPGTRTEVGPPPAATTAPAPAAAPSRRWLIPVAVVAVLLLMLVGALAWWWSQPWGGSPETPAAEAPAATASEPAPAQSRGRGRRSTSTQGRPAAAATLVLRGSHSFQRATLSVYSDGQLLQRIALHGDTVKRYGVELGSSTFTATMPIAAGQHTLTLRLQSSEGGFDQRDTISGRFEAGRSRTAEISLGELGKWVGAGGLTRKLTVRWSD